MEALSLTAIARALGRTAPFEATITDICTDSRKAGPGSLFVALQGERFDGHNYVPQVLEQGAVCALIQHELTTPDHRTLRVENTQHALLDIAAFYRAQFPALQLVGVTGSVGKTTTKDFIACVLSCQYSTHKTQGNQNNEIGVPATVYGLTRDHGAAVIEMGMSGLGEIRELTLALRPDVGVITNIGVSHMEQLGSRENILKAKLELTEGMKDGAPLLLCGDNDLLATVANPRLQVIFYGVENPDCAIRGCNVTEQGRTTTFDILCEGGRWSATIPCIGKHNVLNALAAFGVGRALNIPAQDCVEALQHYTPSGMRQHIVERDGITIVEDCYNASPDSMQAALTTLRDYPRAQDGRRMAVLADMLELGDIAVDSHRQVGALAAACVDRLYCWGELGAIYAQSARDAGLTQARHFETKAQLAAALKAEMRSGDVVWLKASRGMKLEDVLEEIYH